MGNPAIGSTTQTLPSISQASSGISLMETLVSVVNAGSNPHQYVLEDLSGNLVVETRISTESSYLLADAVLATELITPTHLVVIHDTVNALGPIGVEYTTTFSPSSFEATETIAHATTADLVSIAKVWDTFEVFDRDAALEDTITALGTLDPEVNYNHLLTSTVHVNDSLVTGQAEFIIENTTVTDTWTHYTERSEALTDIANVSDLQTWWSIQSEALESSAIASEAFDHAGSIYSDNLNDTVNAFGGIWAKDFGAIAWTMNSKSGALTNYDNYGFDSIAFHGGKLYATSPEGLFEMGADDDDGRDINAISKGGFLDFGVEEKKRVSDIYVGYTGGELECDVETYDGPEEVYTYEMEYRDADAPRNSRLKVGRGLSSRYWRFAFRNIGGADFQIHDVAVRTGMSKRRL